jgi:tetratricopeptide (TPR) repeat protein
MEIAAALERARALARTGSDAAAQEAYVAILRCDPTHFAALNELGTLALAGGFRSAACTAYREALRHHPESTVAHVNLANVLRQQDDLAGAASHYAAALAIDAHCREAHRGMAWVLQERDDAAGAALHLRLGYAGHSRVTQPYRGTGTGVPLLLLVSAVGGNLPTQHWIDDRRFTVEAIYTEFDDPDLPLPPHSLAVNAIGDADLCAAALARAEDILAKSSAAQINRPSRVPNASEPFPASSRRGPRCGPLRRCSRPRICAFRCCCAGRVSTPAGISSGSPTGRCSQARCKAWPAIRCWRSSTSMLAARTAWRASTG